jgi:hypothetical protein
MLSPDIASLIQATFLNSLHLRQVQRTVDQGSSALEIEVAVKVLLCCK